MSSNVLAHAPGDCCFTGFKHHGTAQGKTVEIGGLQTYISEPPAQKEKKGIIFYYSDVFSPLSINAQLLQDYLASNGFLVLGPDYLQGDYFQHHENEEGWDRKMWLQSSMKQALVITPTWVEAAKSKYGVADTKFFAVGLCFGAPFAMQAAAADYICAVAFAHPSFLEEHVFEAAKKPVLMCCAEKDHTFPLDKRTRAEAILMEQNKTTYMIQAFGGVSHGYTARGDLSDGNVAWAREETIRGICAWFTRFSK